MDTVTKEKRSEIMRSIKSKNTGPERKLKMFFVRHGVKGFRLNFKGADIAFTDQHVAIFVDGCFWHGCPEHFSEPKSNIKYWRAHIEANKKRDRETDARLKEEGWTVMRLWEHDVDLLEECFSVVSLERCREALR